MKSKRILIVDDEKDIQEIISYNLTKEGYEVETASSGTDALNYLNKKFDLIILDIMMPNMDGLTLCKQIQKSNDINKNTPIIFLTAKGDETDEVVGLEIGADDYIIKPIKIKILLARIKAAMRRNNTDVSTDIISWGKLELNKSERNVILNQKRIKLTKLEFELLYLLISKNNKVYQREELLNKLYDNTIVTDRVIDVHINNIRQKLGYFNKIIETVHGVGYVARKENVPEE